MTKAKLTPSQVKYLEAAPFTIENINYNGDVVVTGRPFNYFYERNCFMLHLFGFLDFISDNTSEESTTVVKRTYVLTGYGKKALKNYYAKQKESGK